MVRRGTWAAVAAVAVVGLTSCSGTMGSDAQDPAKAQASAAGVRPGWLLARIDGIELQAPKTWTVDRHERSMTVSAAPGAYGAGEKTSPGGASVATTSTVTKSTDAAGDKALEVLRAKGRYTDVRRLPDAHINGTRLYHVQGQSNLLWHDEYGAVRGGQAIIIDWDFNNVVIDRSDVEKLVGTVMPTVRIG